MQSQINLTPTQIEEDFNELGGSVTVFGEEVDGLAYTQDSLSSFEQAAQSWVEYKSLKRVSSESGHDALVILGAQVRKGEPRRDVVIIDYGTIRAVNQ
ncbi:hypothetical protein [Paracidovorax wautersii]|uniref:hypothetical protein n=1 Tax=Paracidovorax wautersii TaxID=1177982 RepID=UPI0031DD9974